MTASQPSVPILDDMEASGGQPHELTSTQRTELRTLFESEDGLGLYLFAHIICGCKELYPPLHLEICEFLSKWGQVELANGTTVKRPIGDGDNVVASWRRLMLCIPRDTFKSTLGTRVNSLWQLTKNPSITIGIFNENEDKPKQWISAIQQVIEGSKLYQILWPDRLPPGIHYLEVQKNGKKGVPRGWPWGSTGLLFPRPLGVVSELSLKGFGVGGSHAGYHFTHIIKDDIIGEKAAYSEATMQGAVDWVDHSRDIERPAHNGCELFNFTRWGHADVYAHTINKWPADYQIYHRSQLEDPATGEPSIARGVSIFPSRMTTKQAKEEWERDPYVFSSQRMCLPMAGRETGFQPSWIKKGESHNIGIEGVEGHFTINLADWNPKWRHPDQPVDAAFNEPPPRQIPMSWISKGIILDPAPSRKSERGQEPRARNGIVVVGMDSWGRWFVLESLPLREDPVTVLEEILKLSQKWKTSLVGIEEVNFSAIYAPLWSEILRGRMEDQLQFFPLQTEGIDKDTRIRSITGPHREGMVFYESSLTLDIQQEIIEYPYGSTRDLIDALAYLPKMLSRPQTIQEVNMAFVRQRREVNQRSPLTGY